MAWVRGELKVHPVPFWWFKRQLLGIAGENLMVKKKKQQPKTSIKIGRRNQTRS